jgi:hypothetical protein
MSPLGDLGVDHKKGAFETASFLFIYPLPKASSLKKLCAAKLVSLQQPMEGGQRFFGTLCNIFIILSVFVM